MKKQLISSVIALVFIGALAASAFANPLFNVRIRAEIPFDFMVGNKKLPKGEYTIETVNNTGLMTIRSAKGSKALTFSAVRGKLAEKPKSKLSFRRYGDQYFLRKIWDGGDAILELSKSKAEKKVAKALKGKEEDEGDEVPVSDKN